VRRLVVISLVSLLVGFAISATGKAQTQERQRAREMISERIQDMDLTDAQESKLAEIRKEWRPKIEAAAKQLAVPLREEVEKIRDVLTVEQLDKLQAMKEMRKERRPERLVERFAHLEDMDLTEGEVSKIAAIRDEYHPKIVKALESLKGTLTDEQREAVAEAREAGKKHKEVFASVNLTDEQKEKLAAVGNQVRTFVRDELEKVQDALGPEQQGKLMELKEERHEQARDRLASAIANCKDLNLTDDQKSRIVMIRQEYRPKIHEAGTRLRAAVRQEMVAVLPVLKG
jgi:Spy/CpxP family protein refolding chaperone